MRIIISMIVLLCSFLSYGQDLKIGTVVYAPPFVVAANKMNYFGFDIELMNGLCQRMKMTCTYVGMPFQDLFQAVTDKKVDLAIGSITITREREANVIFSLPYLASTGRFVTKSNSKINQMDDIRGKRVGVIAGRQYKDYVQTMFSNVVNISEYRDMTNLLQALNKNEVDVVAFSEPMAKYWVSANDDQYNFVGDSFSLGIGLGIMAVPEHVDLITKINKALLDMEADGSYLRLYNIYFGQLTLENTDTQSVSSRSF